MGFFDEKEYNKKWQKENMAIVNAKYKKEFVEEFKIACKELNIKQSDVFRKAMEETILKNK